MTAREAFIYSNENASSSLTLPAMVINISHRHSVKLISVTLMPAIPISKPKP
jgi:hypothetical protein